MPSATKKRQMLRAYPVAANPIGVDREQRIIYGYVVAQVGQFKSGRGVFTMESLQAIVELMSQPPEGTKARYGHPDGTSAQALDSFVGWSRNPRLDGDKVRADLHLSEVAFVSTSGGTSRGEYLLMRAEKEPASLNSSLALDAEIGTTGELDDEGFLTAPVWIPTMIVASDIVDDGDAVHGGLLSTEGTVSTAYLGLATDMDIALAGQGREAVAKFFEWYLSSHYEQPAAQDEVQQPTKSPEEIELRRQYRNRKLLSKAKHGK